MGEYAKFNGQEIKIGTCESMYYLRFEDRLKVQKLSGSLDPATEKNLFWRLPFPDEDHIKPGHYEDFNRGVRLYSSELGDFRDDFALGNPGTMQLKHEAAGLLVSVKCYHGMKLPDSTDDIRFFWNGKGHSFELVHIKNSDKGIRPVYQCRHCREMWSTDDWDSILPYVYDVALRERLGAYISAV